VAAAAGLPEARPPADTASGRDLNYCHEKVPFGTVEAINGNIRAMLRRGRGYRDHDYLLLKVQRATATRRLQQAA
jgi:hypothetical protein